MSTTVYVDSTPYDIPVTDETGWGDDVTAWVIDVSAKVTARHDYTNQGAISLYELTSNGTDHIHVRAPADVTTGGYNFTLPASPGGGGVLQIDAAGDLSIASPLSLDTAYDNGKTIAADDGAITINKSDNTDAVLINKTATGSGYPLRINNAGTLAGAYVVVESTSTAPGVSVYVGASVDGVYVNKADSGGGSAVSLANAGSGHCLNLAQTGSGRAINIALGASASWGMAITNHSANDSIVVVSDTGGKILLGTQSSNVASIDLAHSGDSDALVITHTGAGRSIYLDHNSAGSDNVVTIENAGVGDAVSVTCTANGRAAFFTKATGALDCVVIDNDGTGVGLSVKQDGEWAGLLVNKTATGAYVGAQVVTAGTGAALWARTSNAAGVAFLADGNGENSITAQFTHDGIGTGPVIDIDNSGTGNDIVGTDDSWAISPAGQVTVTSGGGMHTYGFSIRTSTLAIATGVITVTSATGTIRLTAESNPDDLVTINGAAYDGQIIILIGGAVSGVVNVLETGNIVLGASTRSLSDVADRLTLQWDSTYSGGKWVELAFADNA